MASPAQARGPVDGSVHAPPRSPTTPHEHQEQGHATAAPPSGPHDHEALWARLRAVLETKDTALVAYSGGVDSSLIAAATLRVMGPWQPDTRRGALAVLADSATLARDELHMARATADHIGIPLHELNYSELANPDWVANGADRCYHCKADLAKELERLAEGLGVDRTHIAFGITTSDLGDYRPGIAATREAQAWHPLVEAGLDKNQVRILARWLDVSVWDKPATPCLASRVQYGEHITAETLQRIDDAETAVRALGLGPCRVRNHGRLARVEVAADRLDDAFASHRAISKALHALGYTYVTIDVDGFRSGAMNEILTHATDRSQRDR